MADEIRTLHYGGEMFDLGDYEGDPLEGLETYTLNLPEGRELTFTVAGVPIMFERKPRPKIAPPPQAQVFGFS